MPLYEYECVKYETRTERIEKFSGPHLKKCPRCGGKVHRMVSAAAVRFKGSGWYVTDYPKKAASGEQAGPDKPEAKETKEAKEVKGKKEAAKSSGAKEN